jgi:hypothetical protein
MNIIWSGILAIRSSLQNLLHGPLATPQAVALSGAPMRRPLAVTAAPGLRVERTHLRPRPLRVVRVMEAGQPRTQVGRMVISGRMADVCAELDRLAACEAA